MIERIPCAKKSSNTSISSNINFTFSPSENYLSHPDQEIMPGVKWGNYCQLYTAAFWKYMYQSNLDTFQNNVHRLGDTIIEEVVACILGGFGIPSEMGLLAFARLKNDNLIRNGVSYEELATALYLPFETDTGKFVRYRFYNQKSRYIFDFLNRGDLDQINIDNDLLLRKWLLTVNGIGPKTASWITRNWLQSENVAILDIHILRAGLIAGFFDDISKVDKNYFLLEKLYIKFCRAANVLPSNMDAIIWSYMKKSNKLAMKVISNSNLNSKYVWK